MALGNIIGADILNVLLVVGCSAAFNSGGLHVEPLFFTRSFPVMLAILCVFRLGITVQKEKMGRPFGFILILCYLLITVLNIKQMSS